MKFLHIRKNHKNGKVYGRSALVVEKAFKFGDAIGTECLAVKKRFIVMCGKTNSGKSRYLTKLYDAAEDIWVNQFRPYSHSNAPSSEPRHRHPTKPVTKLRRAEVDAQWSFPKPLWIKLSDDQSSWIDNEYVVSWYEGINGENTYKKLKAHQKRTQILNYLKNNRAMCFIDDLDKCTVKRVQFVKDIISHAPKVICTCVTTNTIPQAIRMEITKDDEVAQIIQLTSDASFDATNIFMFMIIIVSALSGQWELAAFASAFTAYLAKGKFSAKQ